MPLNCDCYPGCWGDHSVSWPKIIFRTEDGVRRAFLRCRDEFPYGTYVRCGLEVRVEGAELLRELKSYLKSGNS